MLIGKPKQSFVKRVRSLCSKHFAAPVWMPGTGPSTTKKIIVDLVPPEHRCEKIQFIGQHGDRVAAVLTVGMFREGADWVEAARIIDLVPTGSDQDRLQRFGRLSRDCPGKTHVSYFSLFPYVVEEAEEDRRVELSKLYAHFHASLILENAIKPIKIGMGQKGKSSEEIAEEKQPRLDLLGQLSEKVQEAILRQSYEELLRLHDDRSKEGLAVQPGEAKEVIVNVLKRNGVSADLEATAKQVILVMRRKSNVQIKTDDLVAAGFDKVWSTDIFDGLLAYSAGLGGPNTLSEIRRAIDSVFDRQWMENYEAVRVLPGPPSTQSSAYWWCTHNRVLRPKGRWPMTRRRCSNASHGGCGQRRSGTAGRPGTTRSGSCPSARWL